MIFNSYTFAVFFGALWLLYRLAPSWGAQKVLLLVASYLFYAAWNPPFVALLWLSTVVDWFVSKAIAGASTRARKRTLLIVSLATNLGLLGFFKYAGFALENFSLMLEALGVQYQPPESDIILPVGISFYTFQTLSYTLDVYREEHEPWGSFLDFALFVTFFPQLVAGPIVRAFDFLPQCESPRRATSAQVSWGLTLLLVGLFQKAVIADTLLAGVADQVYAGSPSFRDAWLGTLAFAGQIVSDFAGYSTAAIGTALVFGFELPLNFRFPYAALGFSDFWRRWHISLSQFLRDYLYISLGGNRRGPNRTYANLMITMLIGGLWHGASWNFVVWGGLHGLYLFVERVVQAAAKARDYRPGRVGTFVAWALTFAAVCYAWVFFRAPTLPSALSVVRAMSGLGGGAPILGLGDVAKVALVLPAMLGFHWLMRNQTLGQGMAKLPPIARGVLMGAAILILFLFPAENRAFIYFQF